MRGRARFVPGCLGAALLTWALAFIDALARGAPLPSAGGAAAMAAAAAAGLAILWVLVLRVVGWLLPRTARHHAVPATATFVTIVAAVRWFADDLARHHRDPTMMSVTTAAVAVAVAVTSVALVVPLLAWVIAQLRGRTAHWRASARLLAWVGALPVLFGLALLPSLRARPRPSRERPRIAAHVLRVADHLSDFDGDGSGIVAPPRDCTPWVRVADGRRAACPRDRGTRALWPLLALLGAVLLLPPAPGSSDHAGP